MADERNSTLDSSLREAASTSYQGHPQGFGSERFELLRELGRGGFGVVYEAVDRGLSASPAVALKLLRGAHPDRLYRFKREFRSLAEVRHQNLVQLYELVATGPDVFFTMELIHGESPLEHVRTNPGQARHLIGQLAEGLMALHRAGKLHRDVKPSNILVERGGRVVLLDFGLAIEIDVDHTADRAGTPLYMSPEQCAEQPLQEASDWYAAGTVLFETLTGRTPFEGSVEELLRAKCSQPAPRPNAFAEVPAHLSVPAVLMALLLGGAGAAEVPLARFLAYDLVAALVSVLFLTGLGLYFAPVIDQIWPALLRFELILLAIAPLAILLTWRRRLKPR